MSRAVKNPCAVDKPTILKNMTDSAAALTYNLVLPPLHPTKTSVTIPGKILRMQVILTGNPRVMMAMSLSLRMAALVATLSLSVAAAPRRARMSLVIGVIGIFEVIRSIHRKPDPRPRLPYFESGQSHPNHPLRAATMIKVLSLA